MERLQKLQKIVGYRTLKTAVGAALAIFISQLLGLSYAANSGIIVILSVQNTKQKSRDMAKQRFIATILALAIGTLVFSVIGFNAPAFGVYLLVFIPITVRFGFHDAIVPCSVLVTHLLSVKSVAPSWLLNEFMQMVIGAGIGLLMNIYIPSVEGKLKEDIALIEANMKRVLLDMEECLQKPLDAKPDESRMRSLEASLKAGMDRALLDASNHPEGNSTYFVRYMEMRSKQYDILRYMGKYIQNVRYTNAKSEMAAKLTQYVAEQVGEANSVEAAFTELDERRNIFRTMELPKTREEFENRASLYEYVNELEHIIGIKRNFANSLTDEEKRMYGNS